MTTPLDEHGQPRIRAFNADRLNERAIDELIGIAKGITIDGAISLDEARFLQNWLIGNRDAAHGWPAGLIYQRLSFMLADGKLDQAESAELLALLNDLAPAGGTAYAAIANLSCRLPLDDPQPWVTFKGRSFCFTGRMIYGARAKCEQEVIARGGVVKATITQDLSYLVLGVIASTNWIHSTHGRKIETAVEFRKEGRGLAIVSEESWTAALVNAR